MKQRKKATVIFIAFGLVIGAFVLFNSLRRETAKGSGLDNEIKRLQSEIDTLETRNSALLNLTKEIGDLEFLESEARLKMGMKLPGEQVVVINRATSTFATEKQRNTETEKQAVLGNAGKWWQYFFKTSSQLTNLSEHPE